MPVMKKMKEKPISEMLITTHNHILGFSFIFFITGMIFYFNSIISGFWKSFLLIEPTISIVITFGSIWLMRFVHEDFVYLTILSSVILYLSFFIMAGVSAYELKFKKSYNHCWSTLILKFQCAHYLIHQWSWVFRTIIIFYYKPIFIKLN